MKVGDTKQALILGVVAVGAIGFLFTQLKGKKSLAPAALTGRAAGPSNTAEDPETPTKVLNDPFSNPVLSKLASNETVAPIKTQPETAAPKGGRSADHSPVSLGWARDIAGSISDLPVAKGNLPEVSKEPGNTKPNVPGQDTGPKPHSLLLEAVVTVNHPVALISIDGADPTEFTSGQIIVDGVRIDAIRDEAIVLSIKGQPRSVTLAVGSKF